MWHFRAHHDFILTEINTQWNNKDSFLESGSAKVSYEFSCLSICLCLSIHWSGCPSISLFICPSVWNTVFSGLTHYFFLIILHKVRVQYAHKSSRARSLRNVLVPKTDSKSNFLNFSVNLFIIFFWNCTWWLTLKSDKKWVFWIFKENLYFCQVRVNVSFLGINSRLFELSLKLVHYVFLKFCLMTGIKIG